ncbi:MAG: T9SS type A sorting domain-containing protein [Cytophagaceae bacterium]|jgi:uncharacterized delta-60 repeat protein|nr:T9SS type A sorting domain-containing protein [Cytophagaceae bacterium]
MNKFYIILPLFSLLFKVFSQSVSVDQTFNQNDFGYGSGNGFNNTPNETVVLSDGKIIIVGSFNNYNTINRGGIVRLNPNGSIDDSFKPFGANNVINAIALQTDGKFLIGGEFTSYNNISRNKIARINTDGSLDVSFIPFNFSSNAIITDIVVQPNNKILVAGIFSTYNGISRNCIVRLNEDGTMDNSFNPGTGIQNSYPFSTPKVNRILLQNDSKIILVGLFLSYNNTSRGSIVRINSDGTIDNTFNSSLGTDDGTINSEIHCIEINSSGKIFIGGRFSSYNNNSKSFLAQLNSDGTLDNSFSLSGTGLNAFVKDIHIYSSGSILITGAFTLFNGTSKRGLLRLNLDGTIDNTFNPGTGFSGSEMSFYLQSDNKIILIGNYFSYNNSSLNYISRINTDGTLDISFNPKTSFNDTVLATAVQSDGKILIGGMFNTYFGNQKGNLVRLLSDGTIDNTFNTGTGANGTVRCIKVLSNGKIFIAGEFIDYNGTFRGGIALINSDGSLDNNFTTTSGADGIIFSVALQTDGKIIIVGSFSTFNNANRVGIARLNVDGTVDNTFTTGVGANAQISSVVIQNDGKIIIGGSFTSYNGFTCNRIARLNNNGTFDNSFVSGIGFNSDVLVLTMQSDNKILVGGAFTNYNTIEKERLLRIHSDGSVDNTFNSSVENYVYSITIQSDNKILIGGAFYLVNNGDRNRIARLNSDGTLDNMFHTGYGFEDGGFVYSISIQNDSKIIVGGEVLKFNKVGRNRVFRLEVITCSFNSNVTISSNILTATTNNAYYSWIDCFGEAAFPSPYPAYILNQTNQSYTVTTNSSYRVMITKDGCSILSNCIPVSITSVLNPIEGSAILYPNPSSEKLNILLKEFSFLEIYSIDGKLIQNFDNIKELTIDISSYSIGLYLIKTSLGTIKFIKE